MYMCTVTKPVTWSCPASSPAPTAAAAVALVTINAGVGGRGVSHVNCVRGRLENTYENIYSSERNNTDLVRKHVGGRHPASIAGGVSGVDGGWRRVPARGGRGVGGRHVILKREKEIEIEIRAS